MDSQDIYTLPWWKLKQPLLRWLLKHTHPFFERLLGLTKVRALHALVSKAPPTLPFPQRVLNALQVRVDCSAKDRARIPATGPLAILANHPFGAIEGLALLETVRAVRPDVKVLANFILARIPELRDDMIFVDPFASPLSPIHNVNALRQALLWMKQGHSLIIFPAGEVASFMPGTLSVREAPWHTSVMTLIRRADKETNILPCFIPGRASLFFHFMGKIHPRLRTALLAREMLRFNKRNLPLYIGHPIVAKTLQERFLSDADALRWLRFRTFLNAGREEAFSKFNASMRKLTLDSNERAEVPLIDLIDPEALERELLALGESAKYISNDTYDIYIAQGHTLPLTMHEIGRLRELTFRAIGEGTGKAQDTDDFDNTYHQVILWHREKREIVGCYRLGLVDQLVEVSGLNALYTRTLFSFDEHFLGRLPGNAIELGRAFIRPEYQRAFAPLLLLWRGVLTFVAQHPRYTVLFGPVSISHDYRTSARNLLITYLKAKCYDEALSKFVSARLPPKIQRAEWLHRDYNDFLASEIDVYDAITEIEEDQREMPILIHQYLKLEGRFVAFNVDPDFGTVVDGLIYVDLLKTPPKHMMRYMGRDTYTSYINAPHDQTN
jgi:putative hemolysin